VPHQRVGIKDVFMGHSFPGPGGATPQS
jgi:hypothetical protein